VASRQRGQRSCSAMRNFSRRILGIQGVRHAQRFVEKTASSSLQEILSTKAEKPLEGRMECGRVTAVETRDE